MEAKLDINTRCIQCDVCRIICPEGAVLVQGKTYSIEEWACTLCGVCVEVCPPEAIVISSEKQA